MKTQEIDYKSIYYPPGGILMWIIIFIEVITFCMALFAALIDAKATPELYHSSSLKLDLTLGTLNTFILLISGYFVAQGLHFFKKESYSSAGRQFNLGVFLGILFIVVKSIEYYNKLSSGYGLGTNNFFSFYWLLTGFHLIHVIIGILIILLLKKNLSAKKIEDVEAGTTFWHMCDLIWLLLFPILYLYFRIV
ncbi:cytochrome c oxidase subunit 3 [Flavobacterium sp. H122]|uniref:cytochrome c oxidase subunit 3 n=1 Tax=Flavobacterium sp. H122 TaxID=2529860 RepID=UPI0010AA35A4|nr:cytochrome c oxidase subunit 3 [Flavobacterium sp. H122]